MQQNTKNAILDRPHMQLTSLSGCSMDLRLEVGSADGLACQPPLHLQWELLAPDELVVQEAAVIGTLIISPLLGSSGEHTNKKENAAFFGV